MGRRGDMVVVARGREQPQRGAAGEGNEDVAPIQSNVIQRDAILTTLPGIAMMGSSLALWRVDVRWRLQAALSVIFLALGRACDGPARSA